ncbi:hypothetical protein [Micromonospora sp. DT47]|uniref:hypothetical protein n=1 Tax=Micromonospora sp. DT47 TaxID=3393431 RepID=UPI003CF7BBA0
MTEVLAVLVTGAALLAGATVLCTGGSWRMALRVLLDLLVAVGLLRLTSGPGWTALATAAAIIVLRRLLWAALSSARPVPPTTVIAGLRVGRPPSTVSGRATNGK